MYWFVFFECNGRECSQGRSRDDFRATQAGTQLDGSQIETYAATNGQAQYQVRARYSCRLSRD